MLFTSTDELLATLDMYDQLVHDCITEKLSFAAFLERYDTFYMTYALDGHESDTVEKELLHRNDDRISLHRAIWEQILTRVWADAVANDPAYIKAGRIGSSAALDILRQLAMYYHIEQ